MRRKSAKNVKKSPEKFALKEKVRIFAARLRNNGEFFGNFRMDVSRTTQPPKRTKKEFIENIERDNEVKIEE